MKKYQNFLSENFQILEVNFFLYLNRRVFVMTKGVSSFWRAQWLSDCNACSECPGALMAVDMASKPYSDMQYFRIFLYTFAELNISETAGIHC